MGMSIDIMMVVVFIVAIIGYTRIVGFIGKV